MDIKDFFEKKEMHADEEKPNAEQYVPLFEEPEDIKLFKVVRKLVDLGAKFDIKGLRIAYHEHGLNELNKRNYDQRRENHRNLPEQPRQVRRCIV